MELIFTTAPMEKYFNVKYLENGERYACVTVITGSTAHSASAGI